MKAINLLIFFIIVFIVGIVIVVSGYLLLKSYLSEENIEKRRRQDAVIKEEAIKFCENKENMDCIHYVIPMTKQCSFFNFDVQCMINAKIALRACLESSKVTPGFCDDLFKRGELLKGIFMIGELCSENDIDGFVCQKVFMEISEFCSTSQK